MPNDKGIIIYSFTYNLATKEAASAGNISDTQALNLLQQIVVARQARRVSTEGNGEKATAKSKN